MATFSQFFIEVTKKNKINIRKRRLFAVGCCRQIWRKITNKISKNAVEVAEMFADGKVDENKLKVAYLTAWRLSDNGGNYASYAATNCAGMYGCYRHSEQFSYMADPSVKPRQEALRQCIYTQHPFVIDPPNANVTNVAREIYESRKWELMPQLADALQDAGCDDVEVLRHCLHDKEHARGCWVVDQILGLS